jgi:hypothetical protein
LFPSSFVNANSSIASSTKPSLKNVVYNSPMGRWKTTYCCQPFFMPSPGIARGEHTCFLGCPAKASPIAGFTSRYSVMILLRTVRCSPVAGSKSMVMFLAALDVKKTGWRIVATKLPG